MKAQKRAMALLTVAASCDTDAHVELGETSGFLHGVSHPFAGVTIFVR
jgi:hypothetical protein